MQNVFLDRFSRNFTSELPDFETMDQYLDFILPKVRTWSDSFGDMKFLDTRWREIRDSDTFHESVVHIFKETGECLYVTNGDINKGAWHLEQSGGMVWEVLNKSELYDLAFLNDEFFILRKHGDQQRKGLKKYFVMGRDGVVRGLEWYDCMELLFNTYRENRKSMFYIVLAIIIIGVALTIWLI